MPTMPPVKTNPTPSYETAPLTASSNDVHVPGRVTAASAPFLGSIGTLVDSPSRSSRRQQTHWRSSVSSWGTSSNVLDEPALDVLPITASPSVLDGPAT